MSLINDFLSLIYPRHCEACSNLLYKHEHQICNLCKLTLPRSNYHLQPDNPLSNTFKGRIPITYASSYFLYEKGGKIQRLLHAIKYQGQKELASLLGGHYAAELRAAKAFEDIDCIVPIPLHKNRIKTRGYNQSEWFAKGLAEGLEKICDTNNFVRAVDTKTQTKKRKYQRWENVEGIFEIRESSAFLGKHILLVDDVITTGATLEAAWLAFKDVEGIKVSIASIAFAPKT